MKEDQNQPKGKGQPKAKILREDDGKRTPPADRNYVTGGDTHATRPEQGPDVPPHEQTEGIP
ncbi:hypothetical protein [Pontibacter roseus]|uniref:hypothetical protein n=1 Tax=Pontibacter roseus TaxID=336989 RepID=UPI0003748A0E|nr:hypothetical protein [Pontibacter roseus]